MQKLKQSTIEGFLEHNGYTLVSKYENVRIPIKIKCKSCDNERNVKWLDFKRGIGNKCRNCDSISTIKICTLCGPKPISDFGLRNGKINPRCRSCVNKVKMEYDHKIGRSKRYRHEPRKDIIGKRFGKLVVIEDLGTKNQHRFWKCKCDCGGEKEVMHTHLVKGFVTTCGCGYKGQENPLWEGYGEISGARWCQIKRHRRHAEERVFDITIEQAWELYLKQNRRCALSGIEIHFSTTNKSEYTASLDRIDNNGGYTLNNVQWIHKDLNRMKNVFTQEYFINICRKVALLSYA